MVDGEGCISPLSGKLKQVESGYLHRFCPGVTRFAAKNITGIPGRSRSDARNMGPKAPAIT
jgi:hypothetical protein